MFFGLRYDSNSPTFDGPSEFAQTLIDLTPALVKIRLDEALSLLGEVVHEDPESFSLDRPDRLELGITDFWHSAGTLVIARRAEPGPNARRLVESIAQRPHLLLNSSNHIALEVAFGDPGPHWLGIQVSDAREDSFVLSEERLEELVGLCWLM